MLRRTERSGHVPKWFLSPFPTWSTREPFSNLHSENLVGSGGKIHKSVRESPRWPPPKFLLSDPSMLSLRQFGSFVEVFLPFLAPAAGICSWNSPGRLSIAPGFGAAVCPMTLTLYRSKMSCWFSVCSAFFFCEDGGDKLSTCQIRNEKSILLIRIFEPVIMKFLFRSSDFLFNKIYHFLSKVLPMFC